MLILWLLLSEMLMVFMWKRLIWIFRGLKKLMLLQMFHLYFMEAVGFLMTSWRLLFRKGINKFNVGTEFLSVYYDAVKEYVHMMEGNDKPLKIA